MGQLRHREHEMFDQSHTVGKCQVQDLNPGLTDSRTLGPQMLMAGTVPHFGWKASDVWRKVGGCPHASPSLPCKWVAYNLAL